MKLFHSVFSPFSTWICLNKCGIQEMKLYDCQTWLSASTLSSCGRIASRLFSMNSSAFKFMEERRTGQRPRRASTEKDKRGVRHFRCCYHHQSTIATNLGVIKLWKPCTYRWMMRNYQGLHSQTLCFSRIAPLAGRGANNTQCVQQDARGHIAATQLSQLSGLWHHAVLG